jgi:hypothetical protein
MQKYKLLFILTIFLSRFVVLILGSISEQVYTDDFHHYYIGIVILVISLIYKNLIGFSVGAGLIIDEIMIPIYLLGFWDKEYFELIALFPVIITTIIFYMSFESIVNILKLNKN